MSARNFWRRTDRLFLCLVLAGASLLVAPAHAEPSMWVVRDNDSTIYLIGTVHLLKPDIVWNSEKVAKAIAESGELWLELIDSEDQAKVLALIKKYGVDSAKPLSKKLNAKQSAKLAEAAQSYGLPMQFLEPLKPWAAAVMISGAQLRKAGYSSDFGVDKILRAQAAKEGDKVKGLETTEQQLRFFADLPEKEQIAFLEQTLDYAEEGIGIVNRIAKAWTAGDDASIAAVMVERVKGEAPKLYDKLLVQRNVRWANKVQEILRGSGVHQIAVGAGHLVGPDSVQVQLAKRGVQVERF